jgi:hypothetical protein
MPGLIEKSPNIEQIDGFVQGRTEERRKSSPSGKTTHGEAQKDALKSLADSIKEYVLTALENRGINTIFDPAHGKYWRMYNELEAKQVMSKLKKSLGRTLKSIPHKNIEKSITEISYA